MDRCDCSKCEGARRQRIADQRDDWLADGAGITAIVVIAALWFVILTQVFA